MNPPNSSEGGIVKKTFRKGTQSCVQCRRRKVKCIFTGNRKVCQQCVAHGSECIDQRHAAGEVRRDETLRERVARLESLLRDVVKGTKDKEQRPNDQDISELVNLSEEASEEAPITSVEDRAPMVLLLVESEVVLPKPTENSPVSQEKRICHKPSTTKHKHLCNLIRSSLPLFTELIVVLKKNSSWWAQWREKTFGNKAAPTETLSQYATRVYYSNIVTEMSLLAFAYARSTNSDNERILDLIEKEIIADFEIASTIEGLEVIILQARYYLDIGKPRKSWCAYRHGIMIAQTKNLHHHHSQSHLHESIWHTLYSGDLFTSLLLGLPYGISPVHCSFKRDTAISDDLFTFATQPFTTRLFSVASKIIDRNQSPDPPSLPRTLEMDEELESAALMMPKTWWNVILHSDNPTEEDREPLYTQTLFFLLKTYLHLPFVLRAPSEKKFNHSRISCIDSAREMVKRHHMLRSENNGEALFHCKTQDFIGFMGAVIVLIGIYHSISTQPTSDWELLETTLFLFRDISEKEVGCRMTSQCASALDTLMSLPKSTNTEGPRKIQIPHFGVLSMNPTVPISAPSPETRPKNADLHPQIPTQSHTDTDIPNSSFEAIHGLENQDLLYNGPLASNFEFDELPVMGEHDFDWMDISNLDIDQNWNMFLQ